MKKFLIAASAALLLGLPLTVQAATTPASQPQAGIHKVQMAANTSTHQAKKRTMRPSSQQCRNNPQLRGC